MTGASEGSGFLAVDSGGSGLRAVVGTAERGPLARRESAEPVPTGNRGIDPEHFMAHLMPLVRAMTAEAGPVRFTAVVVGAAGLASLGDALRAELPGALTRELGVRRVALAADAVTAYVGALGPRPGAVIAAWYGPDRDRHRPDRLAPCGRLGASARRLRGRRLDRTGRSRGRATRP